MKLGKQYTPLVTARSSLKAIMRSITKTLLPVALLLFSVCTVAGAELEQHNSKRCSPDGIAVGGYDLVAYHTLNKALVGSSNWSAMHNGLAHHFINAEHLRLFKDNPGKFLPKFSGWCATALAKNKLTCPDYENFKVENGELLLFETYAFSNGRYFWERNPEKNRLAAERNYSQFFTQ